MAEADFDGEFAMPLATPLEQAWLGDAYSPPGARLGPGRVRAFNRRGMDITGALVLGLVFLPIILVVMLLVRRSQGPIFFPHERVGLHGRSFRCFKFRSMVTDADQMLEDLLATNPEVRAEWLETRKLRNDPRVTRVGRFLRRTSLDELPQLWNVLRGDMSLVGPRPVVREELREYGRNLPVYLASKPGLTGLWQVTGRSDTTYRRRVAMDVCYSRRQCVALDLLILLKTVGVVLGSRGAY
jgi:exopolysaccharide production protein ExoY